MNRIALILYVLVGVVNLVGQLTDNQALMDYSKPLLMPLLIYYIYTYVKGRVTKRILFLVAAIIFCWLGDLSLMQEGNAYFLMGLGAFLVGHLLYTWTYILSSFEKPEFRLTPLLPILTYAIFLAAYLLPNTYELQIPVAAYILVIITMACLARLRSGLTSERSYQIVFAGSLLFVVSDSIIGINMFLRPIPEEGFFTMLTYIAGQIMITHGLLEHPE